MYPENIGERTRCMSTGSADNEGLNDQAGSMLAIDDDECIQKGIVYAVSPTSVKLDPRLGRHICLCSRAAPCNCRCQTREGCNIGMAVIRAPCSRCILLHSGCSRRANHTWLKTAWLLVDHLIQTCVAKMA